MPKKKGRQPKKKTQTKKAKKIQKEIENKTGKKFYKGILFLESSPDIPVEKRKLLISFEFDDDQDLSNLIEKLNNIVNNVFSQGLNEAGYTLAYLFLNLMQSKDPKKSEIGLKYLKKLVISYLQTITESHDYAILVHAYILHWFRLVLIYEKRILDWIEALRPKLKTEFADDEIILSKNINAKNIFDMFPTFNPDISSPQIIADDEEAINEFFSSFKKKYNELGLNFAKYYILNIKRYILDKEELQYIFQIQAILGNKLQEIGVEAIEQFITGIGEYFFQLNIKLEGLLNSISKQVSNKEKDELKKKWDIYSRFSGTSFSEIVNKSYK
ncbi:MAG: hypothetical protein HeimC3_04240 [Candidatus Heimdallarchaeota archaeon LC_3]|nr:MAG: hypothetical protein HeimC3_04240 [Candidatus Heimdallarchaeota archaeon LC_3]